MGGRIDIYHSRRTSFIECVFWKVDKSEQYTKPEIYAMKNKPSGEFYAKIVNNINQGRNAINNAVMFDNNALTLYSEDEINEIEINDIVMFNGKCWRIDNVQRELHQKETQYYDELEFKTYISLRR